MFPIIPKSGPEYQPTTMPYRTRPGTGAARELLAQTTAASSMKMLRKLAAQMSVLIFDLISLAAGVAMIAADHQTIQTPSSTHQHSRRRIGHRSLRFLDSSYFIKVADWRRHCVCPCILYKNQGLSRQLQGNSGGQILVLNHYTDPLVTKSAPMAPTTEIEDSRSRDDCTEQPESFEDTSRTSGSMGSTTSERESERCLVVQSPLSSTASSGIGASSSFSVINYGSFGKPYYLLKAMNVRAHVIDKVKR
ncbi:AAEL011820-PA [Aedes aegypti]|uniref:AAEL011820-PA n=1 Tax=Aedes aegypti TaxID=7159 RepID=Q16NZ9_AEDAE|nr:AAEL011820-PA [Aedes aegypti]